MSNSGTATYTELYRPADSSTAMYMSYTPPDSSTAATYMPYIPPTVVQGPLYNNAPSSAGPKPPAAPTRRITMADSDFDANAGYMAVDL